MKKITSCASVCKGDGDAGGKRMQIKKGETREKEKKLKGKHRREQPRSSVHKSENKRKNINQD
jgi:hypothetical protein